MASTFYSDVAMVNDPPVVRPEFSYIIPFTYALTAAPVANDLYVLVRIPEGAKLVSFLIDIPDLDTHATPTIAFDLGDSGDDDRFVSNQGVGQSSGKLHSGAYVTLTNGIAGAIVNTLPRAYTTSDYLALKCRTAAATAVTTGTFSGNVAYSLFPNYYSLPM